MKYQICPCGVKVYLQRTNDLRYGHRLAWFDIAGKKHDGIICRLEKHKETAGSAVGGS